MPSCFSISSTKHTGKRLPASSEEPTQKERERTKEGGKKTQQLPQPPLRERGAGGNLRFPTECQARRQAQRGAQKPQQLPRPPLRERGPERNLRFPTGCQARRQAQRGGKKPQQLPRPPSRERGPGGNLRFPTVLLPAGQKNLPESFFRRHARRKNAAARAPLGRTHQSADWWWGG